MFFGVLRRRNRVRKRRRAPARSNAHYTTHREHARALVTDRLSYWNQFFNLTYGRVAIRNQSTRWGSCSTKRNLNFNYRIAFLPIELADYIIVHELCHLIEFNHGPQFWAHVARALPDYATRKQTLREITATYMKASQMPSSPYSVTKYTIHAVT